jgi:hypothetical protein
MTIIFMNVGTELAVTTTLRLWCFCLAFVLILYWNNFLLFFILVIRARKKSFLGTKAPSKSSKCSRRIFLSQCNQHIRIRSQKVLLQSCFREQQCFNVYVTNLPHFIHSILSLQCYLSKLYCHLKYWNYFRIN